MMTVLEEETKPAYNIKRKKCNTFCGAPLPVAVELHTTCSLLHLWDWSCVCYSKQDVEWKWSVELHMWSCEATGAPLQFILYVNEKIMVYVYIQYVYRQGR